MAKMNLPMALTLARIVAGPVVAALVLCGAVMEYVDRPVAALFYVCAGALFVLAALTDWLDGYFARSLDLVSPLGAALDHCADKVLIACVLIALAFQSLPLDLIVATILLLGRDLFIAGLREGLSSSGRAPPVGQLGKWKTVAALIGVSALVFERAAYLDQAPDWLYYATAWTGRAGVWAAVAFSLVSGWDYVATAFRGGAEASKSAADPAS
ncbi:MAG: CDP-diacylglycerol--glycerol-3-phosphate 3-phosphatidyltransferase [Pseudomonadota bacterium]